MQYLDIALTTVQYLQGFNERTCKGLDKVQSISEQQGRQATASQTSVSDTTTGTQVIPIAVFKVYNEISIKCHNYPCPDLATHLHPMYEEG